MKIILNTHFQIESIEDEKASRIVKGSNLFDELGVYIPQALYNSYTSIYPSYSVKRADNRQLGEYAMATADNTSFTGYYGWKTHLHQRDLAVAGPLEITISFSLDGTVKKTICKVTANVDSAIELSNDVFIVTRGENDEILAIESLVDAVEDLQQECTNVSNTLLTKADLNNANQEITAKKVQAETLKQDGNDVLDSSDVVDNVTTEDATKVLSANQGKALKTLIDTLTTSLSTEYYKKAQTYSSTEIDGLIANFVTKSVNDLTNYYLKSETYNKTEIDNMLSTLSSFEVVQALPTENIKTSVIYLLQNGQFYDEYIYSNNDWVMIGTTNIDFSDYYTKAQINAMLNVINEAINGVDIVNEEVVFEADIPSSAKGLATLTKLGGMSYKSENLFNYAATYDNKFWSYSTGATNLGDLTDNCASDFIKVLPSTQYTITTYISITGVALVKYWQDTTTESSTIGIRAGNVITTDGTKQTYTITTPSDCNYITINCDVANKENVMLNKGSTALPYQPYFEGIRDSAVTAVVSKSANLIDNSKFTDEYYISQANGEAIHYNSTVCCTDYISVEVGKSYYFSGMTTLNSGNTGAMYDSNKNFVGAIMTDENIRPLLIPSGVAYIRLSIWKNKWTDYTKAMLNKGSTALPYEPYKVLATQPIASEIQALEGYGWGVNDTCYNYIDFETKKFVQKVGRVDLGSLNYETSYGANLFNVSLNGVKGLTINLLSAIYTPTDNWNTFTNNDLMAHISSGGTLILHNNSYTSVSDFKSAMSGVYLYFELATPIETDVSSYLGDKHIPIEANGILTFTNTYNQAVPSSITYDCGLVDVVKTNHEHDLEQQKDIDTLKAYQKQLQTDVSGLDTRLDEVEEDVEDIPQLLTDVDTLKGKHLYEHTIICKNTQANKQCLVCFTILNSSSTPLTDFASVHIALGGNSTPNPLKTKASGSVWCNATNQLETVSYISTDVDSMDDSRYIYVACGVDEIGEIFQAYTTITDSVKPLF